MMEKEEEEAIEVERNWADLPPDLFLLILKKLPDMCDFIRSRVVCKPWRFSSSVSNLPPQFPWIIRLGKGPDLELYSIAFNKVFIIHARPSSGKKIFQVVGGCLLTGKEGIADSFSLLNPINNSEVPLPVLHECDPCLFPYNLSCSSHLSFQIDNYMLVSEHQISVGCRPGDDRWDIIRSGHEYRYRCYYFKGFLFRVDCETWVTKIMDINSHKEFYVIPPPKYEVLSKLSVTCSYFLVESCGEILSIFFYQLYKMTDYKFYIHRLKFGNGKGNPCWVKLSSIGDRILFFDYPLGIGHAFCLRASNFVGFNGNCIYFIDSVPPFQLGLDCVINMYDIENGKTIFIDTPFNLKNNDITWFMPTLNYT